MKRLAVFLALALVALSLLGVSSAANVPLAGDLDPSFGSGGVVTHSLGSNASPFFGGIAVQSDGKIIVAGGSTTTASGYYGRLLARYLPNGSPDPSFGIGGSVQTPTPYWASANAIALQPDGKIVVAGSSSPPDPNAASEFTLARYNPDGSLDTSFGTGGVTNTAFPEPISPWTAGAGTLAILPDGKIVAAGGASWDDAGAICFPPSSFALARYTPDGTLDPTFGVGGIVQTASFGGIAGIAVQRNGKIVASGTGGDPGCLLRHRLGHVVTAPGYPAMAVARYEPDGSLDPSFGSGGTASTGASGAYSGGPPILQDGKILVTGQGFARSGTASLVVARLQSGGFHFIARIRSLNGSPGPVLAQKNGKILIVATTGDQEGSTLVRLLPNGRLDTSFGSGGIVSLPDYTTALARQRDKILVGSVAFGGNAWTITRLFGGNNCIVPGVGGKTILQATTTLKKSYCRRGRISKHFSNKVTRGRVISTTPPRSARLPGGTKVDLVVSKGKRPRT